MNFKNAGKIGMLSVAVLACQMALTKFVYPLVGKSTQVIFSIDPVSGIEGTQIGDKVIGYLSGYIPFDLTSFSVWIAMFIGTFVLLFAGMFIYEQVPRKLQGKDLTQRLFAILLYGHAVLYGILYLFKMNVPGIGINLLIGLGINLILVATLVTLSAKYFGFPKI